VRCVLRQLRRVSLAWVLGFLPGLCGGRPEGVRAASARGPGDHPPGCLAGLPEGFRRGLFRVSPEGCFEGCRRGRFRGSRRAVSRGRFRVSQHPVRRGPGGVVSEPVGGGVSGVSDGFRRGLRGLGRAVAPHVAVNRSQLWGCWRVHLLRTALRCGGSSLAVSSARSSCRTSSGGVGGVFRTPREGLRCTGGPFRGSRCNSATGCHRTSVAPFSRHSTW
jgi:hypothetical protein